MFARQNAKMVSVIDTDPAIQHDMSCRTDGRTFMNCSMCKVLCGVSFCKACEYSHLMRLMSEMRAVE